MVWNSPYPRGRGMGQKQMIYSTLIFCVSINAEMAGWLDLCWVHGEGRLGGRLYGSTRKWLVGHCFTVCYLLKILGVQSIIYR